MGKRIHKKVLKVNPETGRSRWVWCDTRLKAQWSGKRCDCGVRWVCM